MRLGLGIGLLGLVCSVAGFAQVLPRPGNGDPRLQTVDYSDGTVVQLRGAQGFQLMVELSPDEQVQNVAVGDSAAWQVSVSKAGDRLFLKPTQAGSSTNMTVVTSVREYSFDLQAMDVPSPDMPYTVQFHYPAPQPAQAAADSQYVDVSAALRRTNRYKVSGDQTIRPSSMTDDGEHTYIVWPKRSAIPAIYALDAYGHETLANGMMRPDDVYVVDGAPGRFTFRIDRRVAHATYIRPKKSR